MQLYTALRSSALSAIYLLAASAVVPVLWLGRAFHELSLSIGSSVAAARYVLGCLLAHRLACTSSREA